VVAGLTSEGAPPADEAEGLDRTSLLLPRGQGELVTAVAGAAKKTVLVVRWGGTLM